ncbi:MAG: DUF1902 domain-containing protein [Mariprofundaceae bacterium]
MRVNISVQASWDEEAEVWVATSKDVEGLVTEAPTEEALVKKLQVMIPELLELNGEKKPRFQHTRIPFNLQTERLAFA